MARYFNMERISNRYGSPIALIPGNQVKFITMDWGWYLEQGKLEIVFVRMRQQKINNYKWGSTSVVISKATHPMALGRETKN